MYPRLDYNLGKLVHNSHRIQELLGRFGMGLVGVTKVACGDARIAAAIASSGVAALGESRLSSVLRLRQAGITHPIWLLRAPGRGEIEATVRAADVSLNSEPVILRQLSAAAVANNTVHKIILMIDLGDLREGIWPTRSENIFSWADRLPGLNVLGIGTNFACHMGKLPSPRSVRGLFRLGLRLGRGRRQPLLVSAGNSSSLQLVRRSAWPQAPPGLSVSLRIGEGIFLGRDIAAGTTIDACCPNACIVRAEVIEVKNKPPCGPETALRALAAIGRQDIGPGRLRSVDPRAVVIAATSDHLMLRLRQPLRVGEILPFLPDYGALLAVASSRDISRGYIGSRMDNPL